MRNLKKFLALVLAMVMAMSLMITANAANVEFDDDGDITEQFEEAVLVLGGLGVFKGTDEGKFNPKAEITRAEVAAIIYRLVTGDINDNQVKIYADYNKFEDVSETAWYAGYVGFCANAEYIKGHNGYFYPMTKVTGYEALAMILRAVGYDQAGEFSGSGWQVRVASLSKQKHVTDTVSNDDFATTLNKAATREVVAELLFRASLIPQVTYSSALGYNDKQGIISSSTDLFNYSLAEETFGLGQTGWRNLGDWGEPGYTWTANRCPTGSRTVATIMAEPFYTTEEMMRECDLAEELDIKTWATFDLYVNSKNITADDYKVVATDTVTRVGGQGRQVKVYTDVTTQNVKLSNLNSRLFHVVNDQNDYPDTIVMIDTMLAKVTGKADAVLDPAGHVITPAKLDATIWDGNVKTPNTPNSSNRIISKPSNSKDNWDEYNVGDYILVNAYTDQNTPNDHVTSSVSDLEKAAFETNKVIAQGKDDPANTLFENKNVWVLKKADVKQGKQSVVYWNQGKHNVDGSDYPDQMTLFLDKAGTNVNTTYNWYFDQFNNIIGIAEAKGSNYGVITSIYAAVSQGDSDTTGGIKAMATVKYTDGTEGTVAIDKFLVSNGFDHTVNPNTTDGTQFKTYGWYDHPLSAANGHDWNGDGSDTNAGTAELRPRYDTVGFQPMSAGAANPDFTSTMAYKHGFLYLAPSTVANNDSHFASQKNDQYGILYQNLFEFITASDESVVAIEVAGTAANTDLYAGNRNKSLNQDGRADNNAPATITSSFEGKLVKNLGVLSLKYDVVGERTDVRLDANTKIIVRSGSNGLRDDGTGYDSELRAGTINAYTLATLPGDVTLDWGSEADWVDENNDGIAEHVYIYGSVPGALTYGLFYYNGGSAQWNGTTGTIAGHLNGKATTVTFNDESQFNTVQNSSSYAGHLFALQLANGVVSTVMDGMNEEAADDEAVGPQLLHDYETPSNTTNAVELIISSTGTHANNIRTSFAAGGVFFGLGPANGNPYNLTTRAIYYRDTAGDPGTADNTVGATNLSYDRYTRTIRVTDDNTTDITYWIATDATVVGEPELLNTRECDVTIVFDHDKANAFVATEVYITPDPDWTPTPDPDADTDNMQILQASYDNAGQTLTFTVEIKDGATAITWATGDSVTLTLKDQTSGLIVVNGVVTAYAAGTPATIDGAVAVTGGHQYKVTVSAGGLALNTGNLYSGRLTLTDADGTAVTSSVPDLYVDNFENLSIF